MTTTCTPLVVRPGTEAFDVALHNSLSAVTELGRAVLTGQIMRSIQARLLAERVGPQQVTFERGGVLVGVSGGAPMTTPDTTQQPWFAQACKVNDFLVYRIERSTGSDVLREYEFAKTGDGKAMEFENEAAAIRAAELMNLSADEYESYLVAQQWHLPFQERLS